MLIIIVAVGRIFYQKRKRERAIIALIVARQTGRAKRGEKAFGRRADVRIWRNSNDDDDNDVQITLQNCVSRTRTAVVVRGASESCSNSFPQMHPERAAEAANAGLIIAFLKRARGGATGRGGATYVGPISLLSLRILGARDRKHAEERDAIDVQSRDLSRKRRTLCARVKSRKRNASNDDDFFYPSSRG